MLFAKSNSTILVKWLSPENLNGIIVQYGIRVMEKGVNSSAWDIHVNATNDTDVDDLKPYTYYMFSIRARTIAGWGDFSETKTKRTLEGRMYTSYF